jgi:hypothetical protein
MPDFRYASYQAVEENGEEAVWIVFSYDEDWTGNADARKRRAVWFIVHLC